MMVKREFACSPGGLAKAQAFLEQRCDEPRPAVILDEIVSNIVRCSGASFFTIEIDRSEGSLRMTFVDDGVPFDPTSEGVAPDTSASLEDRGIGGLGIFMVKKMSKSVAYRREDGKNVLTVVM